MIRHIQTQIGKFEDLEYISDQTNKEIVNIYEDIVSLLESQELISKKKQFEVLKHKLDSGKIVAIAENGQYEVLTNQLDSSAYGFSEEIYLNVHCSFDENKEYVEGSGYVVGPLENQYFKHILSKLPDFLDKTNIEIVDYKGMGDIVCYGSYTTSKIKGPSVCRVPVNGWLVFKKHFTKSRYDLRNKK
jgi:hypothetical protein